MHLAQAREHPASAVRRQQEQEAAILLPAIRHLSAGQQHLFLLFAAVVAAHQPDDFGVLDLADADAADAAGAMAATLETAARGVIYEHPVSSPVAQRLVRALQAALEQARQAAPVTDADAAAALRAVEDGVRRARTDGGSDTAFVDLIRRMLRAGGVASRAAQASTGRSSLIVTPT